MIEMKIEYDQRELKRLNRKVLKLPADLQKKMLRYGRTAMVREIRKRFRTRGFGFRDITGRLRSSFKQSSRGDQTFVKFGGEGARQAGLLEFGTRNIVARHPLSRAIFDTRANQLRAFYNELQKRFNNLKG